MNAEVIAFLWGFLLGLAVVLPICFAYLVERGHR